MYAFNARVCTHCTETGRTFTNASASASANVGVHYVCSFSVVVAILRRAAMDANRVRASHRIASRRDATRLDATRSQIKASMARSKSCHLPLHGTVYSALMLCNNTASRAGVSVPTVRTALRSAEHTCISVNRPVSLEQLTVALYIVFSVKSTSTY